MTPAGRSWSLLAALGAAALGSSFLGCDPDDGDDPTPADSVLTQLLAQVGPGVVLPATKDFRDDAVALREAAWAWVDAGADGSAAAREAAQQAWLDAMASWQVLEAMKVGPAASSLSAPGGADLGDPIYAWPLAFNRCKVDQATASQAYEEAGWLSGQKVDVLGLAALEALLFPPHDENGCPPHVEPNKSGTWEALGDDNIALQRAAHAHVLAGALVEAADALVAAWSPGGGDFGALLAAPGRDGSPYATEAEALDAVYHGLFYVELRVKDRKLAHPLGLKDCPDGSCGDDAESVVSGTSHLWIRANLDGFRRLFTGGDGAGVDDLLEDRGHGDVATTLLAALDDADAAAAALDVPLDEAVAAEDPRAEALYDAVKAVTDLVKGDLATVLLLTIPSEAAGDND